MAREYRLNPSPHAQPRIDYAAELNPQQHEAVTSGPGQALVIAGAGSGKTRTLTYRVAYLLDNGIPPERILLLTFTNKAAREMLERVHELVPIEMNRLWGGTFHSIGNRILRSNAERLGFRKGFSIMDREDQKSMLDAVVAGSGIDTTGYRFPKPEVLGDIFSIAENTQCELAETVEVRYPWFEEVTEHIVRLQELYANKKLETNSMDFDDLLALTVQLLDENADLQERFRDQFEFVLVDEYQDTNQLQCRMIDLLVGHEGNLMVVGDDAQSIYSWRGADVENMLKFHERYPKAHIHKIETNYRSVPEVLSLANAAIAENRAQIPKTLLPDRESKGSLPALVALDNPSAQAAFVAQRILELHDEGTEFQDMAIIYRAHFHSLEIQMELTQRGIPFSITSGLRFFEQAHVKDVAAFMKFVINRTDEVSFMRMVRLIPGVGTASAYKMWNAWLASDLAKADVVTGGFSETMATFPVPKKAKATWEQFGYTLDELVDSKGQPMPPAAMIRSIIEGVYSDYMMAKFKNAEQRAQDLDQLSAFSTRYQDTLEFLSQLALLSGVDTENNPGQQSTEKEAVTLTTAHQAKGLEWNVVFAIWLADGMFPHNRAISDGGEEALEEERRLFYVTVTRAKDELYLSYPMINHNARDGDFMQSPSRFISEVDQGLVEEWNVRGW